MAQRRHIFSVNEYYHIYNRGVDKKIIFVDEKDYNYFLYLLYICNTEKSITLRDTQKFEKGEAIVDIGAYCLMPNHFHLIIHEKQDGGIQMFMRKISTSYAMYFNQKYERTGILFQGRFKSKHIDKDNYFRYLYAYIHLNPLKLVEPLWRDGIFENKKESFEYTFSYPYSSITEYKIDKFHICSPSDFPDYFKNPEDHKSELLEWMQYEE